MIGDMGDGTRRRPPLVSVVVPYWNTPELVRECLASIEAGLTGVDHEVIVVDNGSNVGRRLDPVADARMLHNAENLGFAAAANRAARIARGRFVLFLNSDVRLSAGAVARLVDDLRADPGLAAVAPVAIGRSGERRFPALRYLTPLAQARALFGLGGRFACEPRARAVVNVDWARASTLLVRKRPFDELCGFDEGYFFYEEDEDLCWRLTRRGWRVAVDTRVEVDDPGGGTTRIAGRWPQVALYDGQLRFVRRRCGRAGVLAYRLAVTAAVAAKLLVPTAARRRGRRDRAGVRASVSEVLGALWRSQATVSTTTA